MAITITEFRTRFPEFSDSTEYPDQRIQLFVDDSVTLYLGADEKRWSGKYNIAQSYLVAHMLTNAELSEIGDTNAKAGAISSKSAGGVSVTRAVTPTDKSDFDNFLLSTTYGQQYLIIRNSCFAGIMVANRL